MNLDPGSIIGSYRVIRPLGEGAMGAVYEVEHLELGVHYALKTYTLEDKHADLFRKRFAVEGRLLARLSHPNLVRVIDLAGDAERGIIYYVMDLVLYADGEARTLADIEMAADEDQLFDWFCQLCDALAYVHSQGVVHRDIKLNNILLAPDGHVVLSDFGISRVFGEEMRGNVGSTRTMISGATRGWAMGTQGYMAPEVERGEEATPAADVYSLGVVFFKLLTGLWYEPGLAPGAGGVTDAVKLLADFERPWRDVLPVMLNERPEDRPTDLRELPGYLEAGVKVEGEGEAGEKVEREGEVEREGGGGQRWASSIAEGDGGTGSVGVNGPKKRRVVLGLALLAVVLVAAVGAWFWVRSSAPDSDASLDEAYAIPESVK